jgi:hypothetical protein
MGFVYDEVQGTHLLVVAGRGDSLGRVQCWGSGPAEIPRRKGVVLTGVCPARRERLPSIHGRLSERVLVIGVLRESVCFCDQPYKMEMEMEIDDQPVPPPARARRACGFQIRGVVTVCLFRAERGSIG